MSANKQYYYYDPSLAVASIFTLFFILTTVFHFYQMMRTKTWYWTPFIIGGVFECFGFTARTVNAHQTPNWSLTLFIIQTLGILLAPAFFAASIYMEFGRIILLADGEAHSLVKRIWLTRLFVSGDVLSFLCQAGGTIPYRSLLTEVILFANDDSRWSNPSKARSINCRGKTIIVASLGLQVIFFGFFFVNILTFVGRLTKVPTRASDTVPWKKHSTALLVAGSLILARCVCRIVEYLQGQTGQLQTHEVYLYVLDAGFMLIVMLLFHFCHPSEVGSMLKGGKFMTFLSVQRVEKYDNTFPMTSV